MCLSHLGQIVYGCVAVAALAALSTALGTDTWVEVKGQTFGYFEECKNGTSNCEKWNEYLKEHQLPVFMLLGLSIVLVAAGAIYNFTTFFCICCRSFFLLPLLAFSLASLLTSGPMMYLVYRGFETVGNSNATTQPDIGYSLYIGGVGTILCAINVVIGAITLRWT